ncbi:hypothetical protein McPS_24450 [Marichromatium sp. PS1]
MEHVGDQPDQGLDLLPGEGVEILDAELFEPRDHPRPDLMTAEQQGALGTGKRHRSLPAPVPTGAQSPLKPTRWWLPSQKGLLAEAPQRHR